MGYNIKGIALKFGYSSRDLTKKDKDFINKAGNIRGAETRFIQIMHKKKLCEVC